MQTGFEWGVQFMPFYERKEKILGILSSNEITTVDEIAEKLFISKPTVRRDLEKLSKSGLVNRTHGGATLIKKYADDKIPFSLREQEQNTAKGIMAKKAVEYIEDGYTIMIDGSTSAFAVIPLLSEFKNIIVITNPPTDKSATFDMSYIISGYGRPGADVTMYFFDGTVYRKSAYTWKIGASGLFFKKITLAKGKNALICYAESGTSNQTVPLEITYLGSTFMNTLNNTVINVTQVPTR